MPKEYHGEPEREKGAKKIAKAKKPWHLPNKGRNPVGPRKGEERFWDMERKGGVKEGALRREVEDEFPHNPKKKFTYRPGA